MKIYYWSPYLTNIATINSVFRSAKCFATHSQKKNDAVILNSSGEWDFKKKNIFNVKIQNLYPFNFYKFLPKEGFIQSRFSFLMIFMINFFPLIKKINKDKPDYLVVHLLTILPILLSPILSKNTKIILRISGHPKLTLIRKFTWRIFSKYIYKITAPTNKTLKFLKNSKIFNNKKIVLLRDPVIDPNEILINKNKNFPKFKKKSFFLSIGRLTKQKNFEFLIKMFAKYKHLIDIDYLLVVGEGEEKIKLDRLIKELNCQKSIYLLGFKNNVYNYINGCDTLISTAEYEDPGFVLLEAAFLKKKIISSLVDNGPKEMYQEGNCCSFFELNNEQSFLKAIKKHKNYNHNKIKKAYYFSKKFFISRHFEDFKKILN
jgi:glycosyltransferase involved in cell wall biosynthesis